MSFLVGIDGGTEGLRAFVFDLQGRPKGSGVGSYPTRFPQPSYAEQEPVSWWSALGEATHKALKEAEAAPQEIKAVAADTTCCSVVALDERMEPLRPALIWMDVRAGQEAQDVLATHDRAVQLNAAGSGPVSAEWMIPKALWLKRNEPDTYAQAVAICEYQDYLNYRLTGRYVGSFNNSSIRWHFLKSAGGRPDSLLSSLGISDLAEKWPPTIVPIGEVIGGLTSEAAEHMGLVAGTPVVQGGADAFIGMVGLGVINPRQLALITGSSHLQLAVTDRPMFSRGWWGPYEDCVYKGSFVIEGGQTSTGSIIKWFLTNFCAGTSYAELNDAAERIAPGADGLLVLDHFQGNRMPHTDPTSRGAIVGLTLAHTPAHVYRAVIEGICFGTEAILRAFQTDKFRLTEVVIAGGATKSAFWLQTHADVSGLPLIRTEIADAPALGSAILAAVGAKLFGSIEEAVQAMVRRKEIIEPNEDKHAVYTELFKSYNRMYGAIKEIRENTPKRNSPN
jgi:ribulose kinase